MIITSVISISSRSSTPSISVFPIDWFGNSSKPFCKNNFSAKKKKKKFKICNFFVTRVSRTRWHFRIHARKKIKSRRAPSTFKPTQRSGGRGLARWIFEDVQKKNLPFHHLISKAAAVSQKWNASNTNETKINLRWKLKCFWSWNFLIWIRKWGGVEVGQGHGKNKAAWLMTSRKWVFIGTWK